jgi:Lar family restriction alleviation protein
MSNILPCPFCGSENSKNNVEYSKDYGSYQFVCCHCEAMGACAEIPEEAIKNWNTRKSTKDTQFILGYIEAKREIAEFMDGMVIIQEQ